MDTEGPKRKHLISVSEKDNAYSLKLYQSKHNILTLDAAADNSVSKSQAVAKMGLFQQKMFYLIAYKKYLLQKMKVLFIKCQS